MVANRRGLHSRLACVQPTSLSRQMAVRRSHQAAMKQAAQLRQADHMPSPWAMDAHRKLAHKTLTLQAQGRTECQTSKHASALTGPLPSKPVGGLWANQRGGKLLYLV